MIRLAPRLLFAICALALALAAPAAAEPDIALVPSGAFSFASVETGTYVAEEVAVVNEGTSPGTIGPSTMTGDPSIAISLDDCEGLTLQPDEFCIVDVRFAPTTAGLFTAQLSVPSDAPGSPDTVAFSGIGVTPRPPSTSFTVSPTAIDFGNVDVWNGTFARPIPTPRQVAVSRAVAAPVAARVDGPDVAAFRPSNRCTLPRVPDCTVSVSFSPQRPGPHVATLVLTSGVHTVSVALSGVGVGIPAPPPKPPRPPAPPRGEVVEMLTKALPKPIARWRELGRKRVRGAATFGLVLPLTTFDGSFRLAVRASGKRKRLVAAGDATSEASRLWAQLTRYGKAALKQEGKLRLRAILTFDPEIGKPVTVVRAFTLPGS